MMYVSSVSQECNECELSVQGSMYPYLKQVKDAVAEANNKHAGLFVEIYSRDLSASLIEEVLGS